MQTTDEQRYWIGGESLYGNGGDTLIYRFQRVSPMEVSPNTPHTAYYGSQYVHRTTDGGIHWQRISPDLTAKPPGTQGPSGEPITRDATGEEVYSTVYAIRESAVQRGVIWAGSNDGLVHVTRDDGKTWTNVTPPDLSPGGRVQNIEPSPRRAGSAYVAIYRYLLGDFSPYLYRTDDFGKTWTKIVKGIAPDEPTRVIREDPDRVGLLYAGTEFGMYISFDNGAEWKPFQLNLPRTPVTDMKVVHKDLVLSTQGRGFYILDNITALHYPKTLDSVTLLEPRQAIRTPSRGRTGAQIEYYLPIAAADVKLEILDQKGNLVREFSTVAPAATDTGAGGGDDEGRRSAPANPASSFGNNARSASYSLGFAICRPMADIREWTSRSAGILLRAAHGGTDRNHEASKRGRRCESNSPNGVTTADLQQQLDHNLRVRDLVSDTNRLVAKAKADKNTALAREASHATRPLCPTCLPNPGAISLHGYKLDRPDTG